MSTKIYMMENLGCAHCAARMEERIGELPGIEQVSITFATKQLRVTAEEPEKYLEEIRKICTSVESQVRVIPREIQVREPSKTEEKEKKDWGDLPVILIGGVLFAAGIFLGKMEGMEVIRLLVFAAAYLILGGKILLEAVRNISHGQIFDENFLMCIATIGAFAIAESAEAEVFAHTFQTMKFIMPIFSSRIDNNLHERCCYKLRIGKKVINLCNHSGISDVSCVKMYSENYWTLPGDFQLPVSLIQTRYLSAKTIDSHYNDHACMWLMQFARSYLQQQMIAGEIMSEETYFEKVDGAYVLTGEYSCNEMIGQVKYEENIGQNAEDN